MDIKHYIFLTTGILGLVCFLKLVFVKNNNEKTNNYFKVLIATLTIRQFICLTDFGIDQEAPIEDIGTSIFNFTHYLVLYLITVSVLNKVENKLRYSYHIIVLILFYLTFNAILIVNNNQNHLYKFLIDLLYTGSISYINFLMIKAYFINEKSNTSFKSFTVNWYLLIILIFCITTPLKYLLQIFSILIDGAEIVNYKYQLVSSIVCIIFFLNILIYQNSSKESEKENNERINANEIQKRIHLIWKNKIEVGESNSTDKEVEKRIANKIDFYINKINSLDYDTNILLKKGTTITDLALELKIPKSHLNFIFKYKCTISFVTFKNLIRIEKSKKLIENDYLESNTLNSLAEKVGFKSYDPFFKGFKEVTGIGPMEYRISIKKKRN